MAKQPDVVVYHNFQEEHISIQRKPYCVDEKFPYLRKNIVWRALSFVVYRLIMTPVAFLFCKLRYGHRVVGKEKLKKAKQTGCFVYANHTLMVGDAFLPSVVLFPKKTYVVVNPENLSTPGTRNFLLMSGAIPTPTTHKAFPRFRETLEKRTVERSAVVIYPEAHVWPYFAGIRAFSDTSFAFPVRFGEPVFCFTNVFTKRRGTKVPRVTSYVDGPFYPDPDLPPKEQAAALRLAVYNAMTERAKQTTYTPILYRYEEDPS